MDISSIALGLGLSGNILRDDNINKNNIDKTIKKINRNYIDRYNSNEVEKNRNIIYSLNEDNYIKSIKPNTNMINKIWRELKNYQATKKLSRCVIWYQDRQTIQWMRSKTNLLNTIMCILML